MSMPNEARHKLIRKELEEKKRKKILELTQAPRVNSSLKAMYADELHVSWEEVDGRISALLLLAERVTRAELCGER